MEDRRQEVHCAAPGVAQALADPAGREHTRARSKSICLSRNPDAQPRKRARRASLARGTCQGGHAISNRRAAPLRRSRPRQRGRASASD